MQFIHQSPLGPLLLTEDGGFITGLYFQEEKGETLEAVKSAYTESASLPAQDVISLCIRELDEYFKKERTEFTVPLKLTRAVGGANHYNPLSIIVPCHRVVGADGSLTGYGGGMWRKKWLLEHEGVCLANSSKGADFIGTKYKS